jgi:hypothetical protein
MRITRPLAAPAIAATTLAAMAALLLYYGTPQLAAHVLNGGWLADWLRSVALWASLPGQP